MPRTCSASAFRSVALNVSFAPWTASDFAWASSSLAESSAPSATPSSSAAERAERVREAMFASVEPRRTEVANATGSSDGFVTLAPELARREAVVSRFVLIALLRRTPSRRALSVTLIG